MSYGTLQIEKMTTESGYSLGAGNASSFKNRLINGGMAIDQRNSGAAVTLTNQGYGLDRWTTWFSQVSKYTVQQNQGSVTPPAGFAYYQGVTSSSAYSLVSSDYFGIGQKIEGFNINDLAWGTASAESITISFWVRSSLTGNFGIVLRNNDGSYYYATLYAIASANTWEQKSITIPGPTVGTWNSSNSTGIFLFFGLGTGSSQTASSNDTWVNGGVLGAVGATSLVATSGATWQITGVQLEVGTVATSFDFRSYGTELMLCQRYLFKSSTGASNYTPHLSGILSASTYGFFPIVFPVQMRTTPSISATAAMRFSDMVNYGTTVSSFDAAYMSPSGGGVNATTTGSVPSTVGYATLLTNNNSQANILFSAEL